MVEITPSVSTVTWNQCERERRDNGGTFVEHVLVVLPRPNEGEGGVEGRSCFYRKGKRSLVCLRSPAPYGELLMHVLGIGLV